MYNPLIKKHILHFITSCATAAPSETFEPLALQLWGEQVRSNPEYGRWSDWVLNGSRPQRWQDIPAVPVTLFRTLSFTCFPPFLAKYQFKTSGTTGPRGVHRLMDTEVYDIGAAKGRDLIVGKIPATGVSLVSSSYESSLGHMCRAFAPTMSQCFIPELGVLRDEALERLRAATVPQFIPATAFAMASLLKDVTPDTTPIHLPSGSIIMITGGFKGRIQEISEDDLHQRLYHLFPDTPIVGEYGMSELSSQLWSTDLQTRFRPPPWLRVVAVDPKTGNALPDGSVGQLKFVDLANHQTVLAIETRDQGIVYPDGTLELLGRIPKSEARGCSLSVEEVDSMFVKAESTSSPPTNTKAFEAHTNQRHVEKVQATLTQLAALPKQTIHEMSEGLSPENALWGWQQTLAALSTDNGDAFSRLLADDYTPKQIGIVLARGVFTAGLEWIALALSSGASVHVKVPSESLHQASHWLQPFQAAGLPLTYSNERTLPSSDLLWIFGNDDNIQQIQSTTPHAHCQAYGHRFSIAISGDSSQDAQQVAQDIIAYDTRGCMAPVGVLCHGNVQSFCERLFQELRTLEMTRPLGHLDPYLGPEIRRRICLAVQREGQAWLQRDGDQLWGVLLQQPKDFTAAALPRLINVYPVTSTASVSDILLPLQNKISTIGLTASMDPEVWLQGLDTSRTRICSLGQMQTPPFGRHHDGIPMWNPPQLQK